MITDIGTKPRMIGRKMTNQQRLKIYEQFFHKISINCTTMNNEKIKDAVGLIYSWSYAHRCGNGELSDKQQQKLIDSVVKKMEDF